MYAHSFRDIDNELDVGVVVVVSTTRHFNVLVSHSDVVGVGRQIFWRRHHSELDGALVAEGFVGPFSY